MPQLEFRRPDGKPFKILARGDCTSRRFVKMNPEFFPNGVKFVQNEKSPFVLFLDASIGITATKELLAQVSNVDDMPKTLASFYLGQGDRSILDEDDADLLILDSYADQNFELYEHSSEGWKIWMHPKFIKDREEFERSFKKLGRRTLEQSIEDAERLIDLVRVRNPDIPVLFLNQQVDFYPKLHGRLEYYGLGQQVAHRVPGVRAARVLSKDELALADIGSCGPGLTLHWQKETYAKMVSSAYGLEEVTAAKADEVLPPATTVEPVIPAPDDAYRVSYQDGAPCCHAKCSEFVAKSLQSMERYAFTSSTKSEPKYTPMIIEACDISDFQRWEDHIKGFSSGQRLREKKKSLRKEYYTARFSPRQFVPDMYEIDNSLENRSGGKMRGAYIRSIEDRGGAPDKLYPPVTPKCPLHWSITIGVFERQPGYKQGEVVTDEKLLAYLSLRRTGELVTYAQIMGHGDYLKDGVMILLHHDVIEWLGRADEPLTDGIKAVMYGGQQNGGEGLKDWKRRSGFTPRNLAIER